MGQTGPGGLTTGVVIHDQADDGDESGHGPPCVEERRRHRDGGDNGHHLDGQEPSSVSSGQTCPLVRDGGKGRKTYWYDADRVVVNRLHLCYPQRASRVAVIGAW